MAFLLLISKTRKLRYPGYTCDVKKPEVSWLACHAFRNVLERRQSKYGATLAWLETEIKKLSVQKDIRYGRVTEVACTSS